MTDRQRDNRPPNSRRISWRSVYGGSSKDKEQASSPLVSPQEGVELQSYASRSLSSSVASLPSSTSASQQPPNVPSSRTNSVSECSSPASSRPTTPLFSRWSSSNVLTKQQADSNGLERTSSVASSTKGGHTPETGASRVSGSFGRMSLSSVMGGLSSLSLSRNNGDDGRGRSHSKAKGSDSQRARSSSTSRVGQDDSPSALRSRSMSPFHFRRSRARDSSPMSARSPNLTSNPIPSPPVYAVRTLLTTSPKAMATRKTGAIRKKKYPTMISSIPSPKLIPRLTPSSLRRLPSQTLLRYPIL